MSILARKEPKNLYWREGAASQTAGTTYSSEIDCTNGGRLVLAFEVTNDVAGSLDINVEWNPMKDGSGSWTTSTAAATAFNYCNNFNDGLIDNVDVDCDLTLTGSSPQFFSCPVMGPLCRVNYTVSTGTWTWETSIQVHQGV